MWWSLDFWKYAEYLSAAIVILGVIGEAVSEFGIKNQEEDKKQAAKARRIGKWSTWILIMGLVFELISLVNTNILGEKEIEGLRANAAWANVWIAEANGEARSAEQKAAEANERAGKANERAAKAGKEAARANERTAVLEKEAARLREVAENEKLARLQIEERLRPRRLTQQQREAIRSALAPFSGTVINFVTVSNDSDGPQYAHDFIEVLSSAGWKTSPPIIGMFAPPLPVGLTIKVVDGHNPAAVALQQILLSQGIDAGGVRGAIFPPGDIQVIVGVKPP